jgi:hypothetical protein
MGRAVRTATRYKSLEDLRSGEPRTTSVFRVGLVSNGSTASYCLLRNISSGGVQVRAFVLMNEGDVVQFRVGDSERVRCRVAWTRDELVGLEFDRAIDPKVLLRTSDHLALARRSSPRISAAAWALLRMGGRSFGARLRDISPSGVQILTNKPLAAGLPALLTIPDLPALRGYVCWNKDDLSGVVFERPLAIPLISKWVSERRRVEHDF